MGTAGRYSSKGNGFPASQEVKDPTNSKNKNIGYFLLACGSADPNCRVTCSLFEIFSFNLLFSREVVLEESQNVAFSKMTMTVSSFFSQLFFKIRRKLFHSHTGTKSPGKHPKQI